MIHALGFRAAQCSYRRPGHWHEKGHPAPNWGGEQGAPGQMMIAAEPSASAVSLANRGFSGPGSWDDRVDDPHTAGASHVHQETWCAGPENPVKKKNQKQLAHGQLSSLAALAASIL
jgi:hypothetical protein